MKSSFVLALVSLSASVLAGPCPFEHMKRAGLLSPEDEAKFDAVKRDPKMADILFKQHRREIVAKSENIHELRGPRKRDGLLDLPLGGGLLNGVLQPLTGILSALDIPSVQPQGLALIPGDDPNHQFQAPGPTDVRGICPTLNALANHGYISRDGITSFAEASNAVQTGYGFDFVLSTFLSAVGLLAGGDLVTGKYSIGGADSRVPNSLGPSFPALGLDKHGVFEIDGSITRQDVHFGNNANFLLQRWNEYVAIADKYGNFNLDTQADDNGYRYDISRETNPDFFAGVIWFIVSHAARFFVPAGLANGTTQDDANYANVAPFFLDERFPDQWYRRGDPLTLPQALLGAGNLFLKNPRELGGNQGIGNFVPLDGTNITALSPQALGCFLAENLLDLAPNQLDSEISLAYEAYSGFLKGVIAPLFTDDGYFNCPVDLFSKPGQNAGIKTDADGSASVSSSGSPVNGSYPGIGVIAPDSQPS
ncbi:hypothetical protein K461DRAFT_330031 [Myriangium duriaei CBS 260.36]|uniref:Heme haloperoxidase family profile domain-containing protein n=1 Tax=Myriangium duriaei CBS 260.36 TaxID=1168546 RepID=A0A9P4IR96_9PEZI|nr:hypothetical protein K461DRAFT_330031 [Myriangium duriaei CBS 260.36]